ncbi:beta-lactamase-like protein [Mycena vitilis]|nr:beta-lactamase-like protein [Mycena vitilis]
MAFHELGIPPSDAIVSVKVFDVVSDMRDTAIAANLFMRPTLMGHEIMRCPVFSFLVEHAATGRRAMFDLGIRKDPENGAPHLANVIKSGDFAMPVHRDIVEQLLDNGVDLGSIDAVIWSHAHYDHVGDMSKFPASTHLVFGGSMLTDTCDVNSKSTLLKSDLAGRKLVPLQFEASLKIGGFKAHDFFGDGSFYILDVPGHLAGHVCGLARVTPTSFVFMGGDVCHHAGMFRPTAQLHRCMPCPGELLAAARRSVSAVHFPPPNATGEFDLPARTMPMLDVVDDGYYEEPPTARASIVKLGDFDANHDVFVILAHDGSLVDVVSPFPASLNAWQEKGWKQRATWAFLDEGNPVFRFNEKAL